MSMFSVSSEGLEQTQQQVTNAPAIIDKWLNVAMKDSLAHLQDVATSTAYSRFKNPSGALESRFQQQLYSATYGALLNDSPYAIRRNFGFSGLTDRLGRYYPNDPGALYMSDTVTNEKDWVQSKFEWAMQQALQEIGQSQSQKSNEGEQESETSESESIGESEGIGEGIEL